MTIRDFQSVSNIGSTLFDELTELTQRVRKGEFDAVWGRDAGVLDSSGTQPFCVTVHPEGEADKSDPQMAADERIFIPQEARGRSISTFHVSVRLWHIFQYKRFCILGDIHSISYAEFARFRNCGKKTLTELRELVRMIQTGHPMGPASQLPREFSEPFAAVVGGFLNVPERVGDLSLCDLPLSVRLRRILGKRKASSLGDLNGLPISKLRQMNNCGKSSISEVINLIEKAAAGEFETIIDDDVGWSPVDLARFLDSLILDLSARDAEILELRLVGANEQLPTLETLGAKFKLTRERIRQIVKTIKSQLRNAGSRRLKAYLLSVEKVCCEKVCPLTPELFQQWIGDKIPKSRFTPDFYARLLCELSTAIPTWNGRQEISAVRENRARAVERQLKSVWSTTVRSLVLSEAFSRTKAKLGSLDVCEFFEVLRHSREFQVEFKEAEHPTVELRHVLAIDIARQVLQDSTSPLTPEAIMSRMQANFGQDVAKLNPRAFGAVLGRAEDLYLLGPRSYGLLKHFGLPDGLRKGAKMDFEALLKREKRPVSTPEVIRNHSFVWLSQTNSYELACVLRADDRFIDLGKFLFALAEWGIQEREYVKDLIPNVLSQAGRPLTGLEVLARLQQLRSVSPNAISGHLRNHPEVRDYGFGLYGLKSWGESVYINIVTDSALVERVIRRAEPPLRFARLCEILKMPSEGPLLDKLWQTCAALPAILRLPDECTKTTRLIHKTCRLENALVATAREVNRPQPLYEFQWELNERFGPLFKEKTLDDLRRCLQQSPKFLRNAEDEFILDIHLEQLGLDANAIRAACSELLSQTNEIVGCEDLLERLETDGQSWEDLSADILASLLRDDVKFQELGHNRFRMKICNH